MILLIDNYDSFAHNLARYLRRLGQTVEVRRNDAINVDAARELNPRAIVLSPGPCTPNEAGCSLALVEELHTEVPMLGICLGHQTLAAALGAKVVRANVPMHGRTSVIENDQSQMFAGVPASFRVCRYHSLVVERSSLPSDLHVTASCVDATIMAIEHRALPLVGLQFHPEAILTEYGFQLLHNFLTIAGLVTASLDPDVARTELRRPALAEPQLPATPVTF